MFFCCSFSAIFQHPLLFAGMRNLMCLTVIITFSCSHLHFFLLHSIHLFHKGKDLRNLDLQSLILPLKLLHSPHFLILVPLLTFFILLWQLGILHGMLLLHHFAEFLCLLLGFTGRICWTFHCFRRRDSPLRCVSPRWNRSITTIRTWLGRCKLSRPCGPCTQFEIPRTCHLFCWDRG